MPIFVDGVKYIGKTIRILTQGTVMIDGVAQEQTVQGVVEVRITEGDPVSVQSEASVVCRDVQGPVDAGGSVTCHAVDGSVDAGGSVTCHDVTGNVDAGGSVKCGNVGGAVEAGGSISHMRK